MRLFSDVASRVHDPHLAHAAALAERARGRAWPNPLVGCVVVRDDRIVGEGFHPRAGLPHAEIFALADAGAEALGAHVYVTLEPCAHHGKTPPCVDALVAAGVARVTIGMRDPNPDASGGAEMLSAAGIAVDFAEDPAPFAEMNTGWLHRLETGMPFVTAKSGLSLDARVAFAAGRASVDHGPFGRRGHPATSGRRRCRMVSAATVTADDPALTVRDERGLRSESQPLRVVLVRESVPALRTHAYSLTAMLPRSFSRATKPTLWRLLRSHRKWRSLAGRPLRACAARCDSLGEHGIGSLLVEPGPRLLSALWHADLIDEYVTVTAGGMAGTAPAIYLGEADREGDTLKRRMKPLEAGIVGDVSVTVWGAHERLGD